MNTGVLKRISKIGAVRIPLEDILELEQDNSRGETYRERKLTRIIEEKDEKIKQLENIIAKFQFLSAEAVLLVNKK